VARAISTPSSSTEQTLPPGSGLTGRKGGWGSCSCRHLPRHNRRGPLSVPLLLIVVLLVLALGGGGWGVYSGGAYSHWYGGLGLVLVVILIIMLLGYRL
jgi:hypothetical protein